MTRATAWGFTTSADPRGWVVRAACRGYDPAMFDVGTHGLTAENHAALALCSGCPVRPECRDDYLSSHRTPVALIAGGWWWDHGGGVHPAPPDRTSPPQVSAHVECVRRAITAARAVEAEGLTKRSAAARYGSNYRALSDALVVARYAPDLFDGVWSGDRTLSSAFTEATRRRNSRMEGAA